MRNCFWVEVSLLLCFLMLVCLGLSGVNQAAGECPNGQFPCNNGNCIPINWRCDEDDDCGDNSDEGENCAPQTCRGSDFRCDNGKCIPDRWHCDHDKDCQDRSDEKPETCEKKSCDVENFLCGNGVCIPNQWRCDKQKDCPDGSDELGCDEAEVKCPENEFPCNNRKCISKRWTCDQEDDCGDNSDEIGCPNVTCAAGEYMCGDKKRCIPERWKCDGDNDCRDLSDETGCNATLQSLCSGTEFQCKDLSGECIHQSWYCDGDKDCTDGSDEPSDTCQVTCRPDQFLCKIDHYCISGIYECNGDNDCQDTTDEDHCTNGTRSCRPDEFDCNGQGVHCIPKEKVCDGRNDCGDYEDEMPKNPEKCQKADPCQHAGCAHRCVNLHKKAQCECDHGFKINADNKTCSDIDECTEIHGICSQFCTNKKGGYKCSCSEGFQLDGRSFCKAIVRPSLIFTNRKDVRQIELDLRKYSTLVDNTSSAIALDYNYKTKYVYWSDVALEKIQRASIGDGSQITTVVNQNISTPDGLAVDWIHNLLYWTDTGKDTIEVLDLTLKHRSILYSDELDEPRAIAVDPHEGWMYWTDWGEVPKIEKSGMNGAHRKAIVKSSQDLQWPNGLAIDHIGKRLYWIDAKLHLIASTTLEGLDMRIVRTDPALIRHPFALTVFEDSVYWTDWASESIQSVNKFSGKNDTIALQLHSPMDIHIFHPHVQREGKNRCGANNGNCEQLCLPAPKMSELSAQYSCACSDGFQPPKEDDRKCVEIAHYRPLTNGSTGLDDTVGNITDPNRTSNTNGTAPRSTVIPASTAKSTESSTSKTTNQSKKPASITTVVPVTDGDQGYMIHPVDNSTIPDLNKARNKNTEDQDGGRIAMIVVGIVMSLVILLAVIGYLVYRHHVGQNKKTMNFDNPVYRKTTEEQFAIEKGMPARALPSTLQPLTGENEYA